MNKLYNSNESNYDDYIISLSLTELIKRLRALSHPNLKLSQQQSSDIHSSFEIHYKPYSAWISLESIDDTQTHIRIQRQKKTELSKINFSTSRYSIGGCFVYGIGVLVIFALLSPIHSAGIDISDMIGNSTANLLVRVCAPLIGIVIVYAIHNAFGSREEIGINPAKDAKWTRAKRAIKMYLVSGEDIENL